jgi:hypothetical protein
MCLARPPRPTVSAPLRYELLQIENGDLAEYIGLLAWEAYLTDDEMLDLATARSNMFQHANEYRLADWQQEMFFSAGGQSHQEALARCRTERDRALLELERELSTMQRR